MMQKLAFTQKGLQQNLAGFVRSGQVFFPIKWSNVIDLSAYHQLAY